MATQNDKTTKATLQVDLTVDTTQNIILNNVNPTITDVVFGQVMVSVAGVQSHSLNTLKREDKYYLTAE